MTPKRLKTKKPLSAALIAPLDTDKKSEHFLNATCDLQTAEKSKSLVNVTVPTTPAHNNTPLHKTTDQAETITRYVKSTRYQKLQPKSISSVVPMPTITQSFRMDSLEKENSVCSVNSTSKNNLDKATPANKTTTNISNNYSITPTTTPIATNNNNNSTTNKIGLMVSSKKLDLLKVTPSQSVSASMSRSSSKRQITYTDNSSNIYQNEYSVDTNDPVSQNLSQSGVQMTGKRNGDNLSIISSKISLFKRTVS